jgi:Anti-sigma-K factor rskA
MAGHATLSCEEFLDLAAVVAIDAADPDDARRVEDHAASCPDCRARLDEFRAAAAGLATVVPQVEPPPDLRDRLLASVAREPRRLSVIQRLWPRSVRGPRLSPAWLVAAASLVVAIAALAWVAVLQVQISDLRTSLMLASERAARFDRVTNVLASDRLAVKPLQPSQPAVASTGYVFLDPASGTGMLMCHDLPPVPQGHAYQVWFVRGNDRVSGGMLWPDPSGDGYTMIQLPPDVQSFDSIGLTDEPGSGSAWPTSPRVIGTPLKESSQ